DVPGVVPAHEPDEDVLVPGDVRCRVLAHDAFNSACFVLIPSAMRSIRVRARAATSGCRVMTRLLSCLASPLLLQLVEPSTESRPSMISSFSCMMAFFSLRPMTTELDGKFTVL